MKEKSVGGCEVNQDAYFREGDRLLLDGLADDTLLQCPPPGAEAKVVVTIPAKNEEGFMENTLSALAFQKTFGGRSIDFRLFEVLVLCHQCTDATAEICHQAAKRYPWLNLVIFENGHPEINNVGAVRRVLMHMAAERISDPLGYIAMTDADTLVDGYWISNILGYIDSGYGLICGRIEVDTTGLAEPAKYVLHLKQEYSRLRTYLENWMLPCESDPAPRHSDNSGPNLAVRADVYREVGGMPPIGFCEDVAFYDRIIWKGHKVRHCPFTAVRTSGRTEVRAPWGFGAELSTWGDGENESFMVENLEGVLTRLRINRWLAEYAHTQDIIPYGAIAKLSGIPPAQIAGYFEQFSTVRAITHRLEKDLDSSHSWGKRFPKIPISIACAQLRDYLATLPSSFCQS